MNTTFVRALIKQAGLTRNTTPLNYTYTNKQGQTVEWAIVKKDDAIFLRETVNDGSNMPEYAQIIPAICQSGQYVSLSFVSSSLLQTLNENADVFNAVMNELNARFRMNASNSFASTDYDEIYFDNWGALEQIRRTVTYSFLIPDAHNGGDVIQAHLVNGRTLIAERAYGGYSAYDLKSVTDKSATDITLFTSVIFDVSHTEKGIIFDTEMSVPLSLMNDVMEYAKAKLHATDDEIVVQIR